MTFFQAFVGALPVTADSQLAPLISWVETVILRIFAMRTVAKTELLVIWTILQVHTICS